MHSVILLQDMDLLLIDGSEEHFAKGHLFEFASVGENKIRIWDATHDVVQSLSDTDFGIKWAYSDGYAT